MLNAKASGQYLRCQVQWKRQAAARRESFYALKGDPFASHPERAAVADASSISLIAAAIKCGASVAGRRQVPSARDVANVKNARFLLTRAFPKTGVFRRHGPGHQGCPTFRDRSPQRAMRENASRILVSPRSIAPQYPLPAQLEW